MTRRATAVRAGVHALIGASLVASLTGTFACGRGSAAPARDAVQEAFRDGGRSGAQAEGHRLFVQHCATCHGAEGRGDGQNAYTLDPPPPDFQASLARLPVEQRRRVVEDGTAAIGRSPLCPPRRRALSPEETDAITAWLEVASRPSQAATSPGSPRGRRRPRP